jgi:peptide deformylase
VTVEAAEVADLDALPIVSVGDPVLRRRAERLAPEDLARADIRRLIRAMRVTMESAPGVGLAAPQIGESIQLAVLSDGPERMGHLTVEELADRERTAVPFTVLVNPVLEALPDERGSAGFFEGCLSVPRLTGYVRRHRVVRVRGLDERGEPRSWTFRGWPARIAQHEIDHLLGILFLDRVETRSLATSENYVARWSGKPLADVADALGFSLDE